MIKSDSDTELFRVLAWDNSGSTDCVAYYFDTGLKYLERFHQGSGKDGQVNKFQYLVWGSGCFKSSYEDLKEICRTHQGRGGGTAPQTCVHWIINNNKKNKPVELWLITDGEIDRGNVEICAALNTRVNYHSVKFIVINQGRIDLSVGAAFFQEAEIEIYENERLAKQVITSVPFPYAEVGLDTFESKYTELSDYIQAKFMGTDRNALEEGDKLTKLRDRLLSGLVEESGEDQGSNEFLSKEKDAILMTLKSLQFYKTLTSTNVLTLRQEIDGKISTLINYIHNKQKSFNFNSIKIDYKSNQMQAATEEAEPGLETLEDYPEREFHDAVTLEDEGRPVLLLNVTDLIDKLWIQGNYKAFQLVVNCPLSYEDLKLSIGHGYSVESYLSLIKHRDLQADGGAVLNPMNKLPSFGILFCEEANEYNDYMLAKALFRGKRVSPDFSLWYFMIWKACEDCDWVDEGIVAAAKDYALKRLATGKVRLGFTCLPLDPKEIVPVPIACFYSAQLSSELFAENPSLFSHERLRLFSPSAVCRMVEILRLLEYPVDKGFVWERVKVLKFVNALKRIPKPENKKQFLLKKIFITVEGFLTWEIENPSALKYLSFLNYSHQEVIPFEYEVKRPINVKSLVRCFYQWSLEDLSFSIHPRTCRPQCAVKVTNAEEPLESFYKQALELLRRPDWTDDGESSGWKMTKPKSVSPPRMLSPCKMFMAMTADLERYPNDFQEFSRYVHDKRSVNGDKVMLFEPNVVEHLRHHYEKYTAFCLTVEVKDFIQATSCSLNLDKRLTIEECFGGDKELIKKFIEKHKSYLTENEVLSTVAN